MEQQQIQFNSSNQQLVLEAGNQQLQLSHLISTKEYRRHSLTISIILTIAYTLVFLIGLLGNSFVVIIVCKSPRMRTVTNYFIANLALADILVLLFCLPATLVSNLFIPYVLGLFVCKTVSYLQGVAVSASINTMVAVTMDRFLAICFPMDWHMSRKMARVTIACIWLFSLCISLPWALYFTLTPYTINYNVTANPTSINQSSNQVLSHQTNTMLVHLCEEDWPSERMGKLYFIGANLILLYLFPAIIIILCYLGIWFKINRRNIPGDRPKGLKIELIMQKSKLKIVKMMMVVVILFLLSWLPLYLIWARIKLAEERSQWEDWLISNLMPLAQWLGASNSCINPILYTIFNRRYKKGFIDLLMFGFCCKSINGLSEVGNKITNNNNTTNNHTNNNITTANCYTSGQLFAGQTTTTFNHDKSPFESHANEKSGASHSGQQNHKQVRANNGCKGSNQLGCGGGRTQKGDDPKQRRNVISMEQMERQRRIRMQSMQDFGRREQRTSSQTQSCNSSLSSNSNLNSNSNSDSNIGSNSNDSATNSNSNSISNLQPIGANANSNDDYDSLSSLSSEACAKRLSLAAKNTERRLNPGQPAEMELKQLASASSAAVAAGPPIERKSKGSGHSTQAVAANQTGAKQRRQLDDSNSNNITSGDDKSEPPMVAATATNLGKLLRAKMMNNWASSGRFASMNIIRDRVGAGRIVAGAELQQEAQLKRQLSNDRICLEQRRESLLKKLNDDHEEAEEPAPNQLARLCSSDFSFSAASLNYHNHANGPLERTDEPQAEPGARPNLKHKSVKRHNHHHHRGDKQRHHHHHHRNQSHPRNHTRSHNNHHHHHNSHSSHHGQPEEAHQKVRSHESAGGASSSGKSAGGRSVRSNVTNVTALSFNSSTRGFLDFGATSASLNSLNSSNNNNQRQRQHLLQGRQHSTGRRQLGDRKGTHTTGERESGNEASAPTAAGADCEAKTKIAGGASRTELQPSKEALDTIKAM